MRMPFADVAQLVHARLGGTPDLLRKFHDTAFERGRISASVFGRRQGMRDVN